MHGGLQPVQRAAAATAALSRSRSARARLGTTPTIPDRRSSSPRPDYEDWHRDTRGFEDLGIWEYLTFNLAADTEPAQVRGLRASSSLFTVLGVAPALGRVFTADGRRAGHRVAVISDAVWRTHFGADAGPSGGPFTLNGAIHEVIGVMPPGFEFPAQGNGVWIPIAFTEQDRQRGSHSFYVAAPARSRGSAFDQAQRRHRALGRALAERYEENREEGSDDQPMAEYGLSNVRRILVVLSGAVGLVLLIACVNVANLQLGLGLARRREFVLRLSLGAGLRRLTQQVLCESLVLSRRPARRPASRSRGSPRARSISRCRPDSGRCRSAAASRSSSTRRVLLFAAGAAIVSASLFGLWPLVGLRRAEPQPLLRQGERGCDAARRRRATRSRHRGNRARHRRAVRRRPDDSQPPRTPRCPVRARSDRTC